MFLNNHRFQNNENQNIFLTEFSALGNLTGAECSDPVNLPNTPIVDGTKFVRWHDPDFQKNSKII